MNNKSKVLKRILIVILAIIIISIIITVGVGNYFVNYAILRTGNGGDREVKNKEVVEVASIDNETERIISSLSLVILEIKSYMLDIDCLFLDPQYMYMNMSAKSIEFVYYPEKSFDFDSSLKTLFEYILEKYDHNSDKMQLMNVYSIYQKIVQGQYDINNLMQLFVDER